MLEHQLSWCGLRGSWETLSEGHLCDPARRPTGIPAPILSLKSAIQDDVACRLHPAGRSKSRQDVDPLTSYSGGRYWSGLPNPQKAKAEIKLIVLCTTIIHNTLTIKT